MKFDPQIHHRHSIRLKGYDYSQAGAYYITIVAWHRECLFGEVVDGEMRPNAAGKIVQWEWENIAPSFKFIELGASNVMPNHFHGILLFGDVGATRPGGTDALAAKAFLHKPASDGLGGTPIWQRNYYKHIIRNEREMAQKWNYIESNPAMWDDDEENPVIR